jgi:hypothetical protein
VPPPLRRLAPEAEPRARAARRRPTCCCSTSPIRASTTAPTSASGSTSRAGRGEGIGVVVVTHLLADQALVDRVVELTIATEPRPARPNERAPDLRDGKDDRPRAGRRRIALGLLTALPLAFYGGSVGRGSGAVITGGVAMAFSIAGASIFVALTARPVDPRLILAGYHPTELLLGRLLLLELFGVAVAGLFSVVMVFGSTRPTRGRLAAASGSSR